MKKDNTTDALFSLIRAGLWEEDANISSLESVSLEWLIQQSEKQAVLGLLAAGLEHVKGVQIPKDYTLQLVGQVLEIEKRNKVMNIFLSEIIEKMRTADIYTLLVKGQGVAQCYKRPLWRISGDIDLLLSKVNYVKAKELLLPLSSSSFTEGQYSKHLALNIGSWCVELQGTLRSGLSSRVDKVIDDVQKDVIYSGSVRSWQNGKTQIFMPSANNDIFFVFVHFLKHFYKEGGANLRQICDWCRIIWTYKDSIDINLLNSRVSKAGLMSEWKAFAALAVDYLGMPKDAMPFYSDRSKWRRIAEKIAKLILNGTYKNKYLAVGSLIRIFPINTLRFLPGILFEVNMMKANEWLSEKIKI